MKTTLQTMLAFVLLFLAWAGNAQNIEFENLCSDCHSPSTIDLNDFDYDRDDIIDYINDEMPRDSSATPEYEPDLCVGACAETIADYLLTVAGPINTPPEAEISGNRAVTIPVLETFIGTNSSDDKGIVQYVWEYDDGRSSTGTFVSQSYTEVGNFPLSLTVYDAEGLTDTSNIIVKARPALNPDGPSASFSVSAQTGPVDFTVDFDAGTSTSGTSPIVSYKWDFGDGTFGYGEQASHTYTVVGTYSVLLVVTDANGLQSASETVLLALGNLEHEIQACMQELGFNNFNGGSCYAPGTRSTEDPIDLTERVGHIVINDKVDAVFHCSAIDEVAGDSAQVELIFHNRENGKTCFFEAAIGNLVGTGEPIVRASVNFPALNGAHSDTRIEKYWRKPPPKPAVALGGRACTACHTTGGPYVIGPESAEAMSIFGLINDGHDTTFDLLSIVRADEGQRETANNFIHSRAVSPNCANECHALRDNNRNIFREDDNAFGPSIIETGLELFDMGLMPGDGYEENPYRWINHDSLDEGGDGEYFEAAKARFPVLRNCNQPSWLEARAVDSEYVFTTNPVFPDHLRTFNLRDGLECVNNEQADGMCSEYQTQYLCENYTPGQLQPAEYTWTGWLNADTAAGNGSTGDYENRYRHGGLCANPVALEARTLVNGNYVRAYAPNDKLARFDALGLECRNQDQTNGGQCSNYVVRYRGCDEGGQTQVYRIVNAWSGTKVAATSWENNTEVRSRPQGYIWPSQSWGIIPIAGTPYVRIMNMYSGLYLNVESDEEYARVMSYYFQEDWGSMKWQVELVPGTNQVRFRNEWTGRYLTVTNNGNDAEVRAQSLNLTWASQRWYYE